MGFSVASSVARLILFKRLKARRKKAQAKRISVQADYRDRFQVVGSFDGDPWAMRRRIVKGLTWRGYPQEVAAALKRHGGELIWFVEGGGLDGFGQIDVVAFADQRRIPLSQASGILLVLKKTGLIGFDNRVQWSMIELLAKGVRV